MDLKQHGTTASDEPDARLNEAVSGNPHVSVMLPPMEFALAAPANNERSPRYMEKALAAIHQTNRDRRTCVLDYGTYQEHVGLFFRTEDMIAERITGPILANYPGCTLSKIVRPLPEGGQTCDTWSAELAITPELFPIVRHAQFEDLLNGNFADPINSILQAIRPEPDVDCRIEFWITPATRSRTWWATTAVRRLDRPFFRVHERLGHFYAHHVTRLRSWPLASLLGMLASPAEHPHRSSLETSAGRHHEREEDLQAASEKMSGHLFETRIRLVVVAAPGAENIARRRIETMAGAFGAFTRSRLARFHLGPIRRGTLRSLPIRGFLLSHEELATLWHPPTSTVGAERMQTREYAELEAPPKLAVEYAEGAVTIGRTQYRDDKRLVSLARDDRRRHLYVVGKTGMGKTTLLLNMLRQDIHAGMGVGLIDPHGDFSDAIARMIPNHRTNDVVLFDVGDKDYAVAFNPLACPDPAQIDSVASGVVSAFKKLHDSWGPRLEDTLRNAVFATIEHRGTLLTMLRLLADKSYREGLVPQIRDHIVRSFWMHEFSAWNDRYRTEAVAAIQNKIRPFLTNAQLRAIVSQSGKSLDLRQVMDEGRVLIVNLSKGRVGEDNANLLGALLVTSLQQAAMTRADVPEVRRRDFHLYIDEFQNFSTGSFSTILSEARKYRLNLTIAHQYLGQLDEPTTQAVFGNVGSIIALQVGSDDADALAAQLSKFPGQLTPADLMNVPRYTAYARLLIEGMPTNPFSISTLPSPAVEEDRYDTVYRRSMRQYARPMSEVRRDIERGLALA